MTGQAVERRAATIALVTGAMLIAQLVAAKATRDALFLQHFPATTLPRAMIAAGVLSVGGSGLMATLLPRLGPLRLIPALFSTSALLMLGEYALYGARPGWAAALLYLHLALFSSLLVSGFWTVVGERFDPHRAKRTIARVGAAAAAGGVLGGLIAQTASGRVGVAGLLVMIALAQLGCALGVRAIGAPEDEAQSGPGRSDAPPVSLRVLARDRYLAGVAGLMLTICVIDALLDYALKASAEAYFDHEELISFFAAFYTGIGLAGFLLQLSLGERVLRRYGLVGAMRPLPALTLLSTALAAGLGHFVWVVGAKAIHSITENSLFGAGFQLLYTPLSPARRRAAKPLVDVAGRRLGDIFGGALVMGLLFIAPGAAIPTVLLLSAALACGGLYLVDRLGRGYVNELSSRLSSGQISLSQADAQDATTLQTLLGTHGGMNRSAVLAEIRARQANEDEAYTTDPQTVHAALREADLESLGNSNDARLVRALIVLDSASPEVFDALLDQMSSEMRLLPSVIPRLAEPEYAEICRSFLRRLAPRCSGQLIDVLLDDRHPIAVRTAIPALLERCRDQRAADELARAIEDPNIDIRFAAADGLTRIVAREPALARPRALVLSWMQRELAASEVVWRSAGRTRPGDPLRSLLLADTEIETDRSLELVFLLLALGGEVAVAGSALRSLHGRDARLRGTALEYLETTLPAAMQRPLFERLPDMPAPGRRSRGGARGESDLASELLESKAALALPADVESRREEAGRRARDLERSR